MSWILLTPVLHNVLIKREKFDADHTWGLLFTDVSCWSTYLLQRAKKVVSDSPGIVDFAIGLAIFVFNLPDGQALFFGKIQITEGLINPANQKGFSG